MSTDRRSALPPGVDGVEIKVTLGAAMVERGRQAFRIGLAQAERRSIWFAERLGRQDDSAELPLLSRGVIIRIRQREGEDDDATLKLRDPEGCLDPDLWRERTKSVGKRAKLEGDWVGKRHLLSASLDGKIEDGRIHEVVAEQPQQVRRLLSEAQQALAEELLLPLEEVQLLGPVRAAKWSPGMGELGDIAAELWEVGDQLRFLELSVLAKDDPLGHQQRLEETVGSHSLEVDPKAETKTRTVLEHFAAAASRDPAIPMGPGPPPGRRAASPTQVSTQRNDPQMTHNPGFSMNPRGTYGSVVQDRDPPAHLGQGTADAPPGVRLHPHRRELTSGGVASSPEDHRRVSALARSIRGLIVHRRFLRVRCDPVRRPGRHR